MRYCVKVYIYGAPFPHIREFRLKRNALAYFESTKLVTAYHDVELMDRKGATL